MYFGWQRAHRKCALPMRPPSFFCAYSIASRPGYVKSRQALPPGPIYMYMFKGYSAFDANGPAGVKSGGFLKMYISGF